MIEYRPPEVNYIKKMTPIKSTPTQLAHFMKGSQAITLQMSYAYLNQNTAIFSKLRFTKLYCSCLYFSFVFPSKNSSQRLRQHIFIQEILGELSSGHMLTPELFFFSERNKGLQRKKRSIICHPPCELYEICTPDGNCSRNGDITQAK